MYSELYQTSKIKLFGKKQVFAQEIVKGRSKKEKEEKGPCGLARDESQPIDKPK